MSKFQQIFLRVMVLVITLIIGLVPLCFSQKKYDIVFRGGTVVDGSGSPRFQADVAIRGDRIVRVAPSIPETEAKVAVDATGLIVAPGFICNHSHIGPSIPRFPLEENFIRQGISTMLATQHSGDVPWPLKPYMDSIKMAPNVGFFAGHNWVRRQVLGLENRAPTPQELERMKSMVEQNMLDGALGLSTGLEYVPAYYSSTEEVIELAKVAAKYGGIFVTHMRDEGPGVVQSVEETIQIAREAQIPAQINHHKAVGAPQFGLSKKTLALIDSARTSGLDIKVDLYPYIAFSTGSSILFPQWCLADGPKALAKRLTDPDTRARIEKEVRKIFLEQVGEDLRNVQFRRVRSAPSYSGRTLADYVIDNGQPATLDVGIRALIDLQLVGGFSGIFYGMDEDDVKRIMQYPWAMFDTDGDSVRYGMGFPHPRSYGAFPRVLARYVREQKVLTLEEAIRKMTSLPAQQINQTERGLVKEGMYADLAVFDADKIEDLATYTDPHRFSVGIMHLIINGVPVIRNAAITGEKPGRVLKGPARPEAVKQRSK
ncbi:amidohydrolase family protein [Acidobacteriota bacterium]